jgi:hypothetical protein
MVKKPSHATVPLKEEEERRSLTATDVFHSISFCQSHPRCFNFTKGEFKLKTRREEGREGGGGGRGERGRGNRSARWGGGGGEKQPNLCKTGIKSLFLVK